MKSHKEILGNRKDSRKTFFESNKKWYGYTRKGLINVFNSEKIVVGYIVSGNTYCIDDSKNIFMVGRAFGIVGETHADNLFLLGIFNSKLSEFIMKKRCPIKKGGFYKISSKYLNNFPIPQNKNLKERIIKLVKNNLSFYNESNDIQNSFLQVLKTKYSFNKISKKLEEFWQLNYAEFVKEVERLVENEMNLDDSSTLFRHFEFNKKKLISLFEKINKIEHEIDELVYKLYNLNKDETLLVERRD